MAPGETLPKSDGGQAAIFATTHWSVVMLAGQENSPVGTAALERLCRAYWFPIYAEVRRRGLAQHDAQDYTQEFFAVPVWRHSLARVAAEKGRLPAFLLASMKYFSPINPMRVARPNAAAAFR